MPTLTLPWRAGASARRLAALALLAALPLAAGAAELKLRLMQTTDVHVHLVAWDYYQDKPSDEHGYARTLTLIKAARGEVKNSMLFDNGDLIQGNPMGDLVAKVQPLRPGQMHPAHKVLALAGADAANIGNHEFNYGLPFLRQVIAAAPFPLVSANVVLDQPGVPDDQLKPAFTPYAILDRRFTDEAGATHALKVGVLGLVPPQIMMWDRANLTGQVKARDIVDTARRLVPQMRAQGADVVVVIAHSGFERGETVWFAENAVARLAEIEGVDAVLFGHSHGEFPGRFFSGHPKVDMARGTINGVPAVMPGFWGSHLGVIDLTLDNATGRWRARDGSAHLRPVWDRATRKPLAQPDPAVEALVRAEHEATLAYMRAEIARTTAPITSYFAQVADDPSVQVVSAAQMAFARQALAGTPHAGLPVLSAAAPFKAGGRIGWGYYTDIPAGPIALRHVSDLYIYPNTFKAVKVTGAQVREWLEMSALVFNRIDPAGPSEQNLINEAQPTYNFDTIDGVTYAIDVTQPARYDRQGKLVAPQARRIVDLRFNGQPIDEAASFIVATNNYRAAGGGYFPGLDGKNIVVDSADENREALVQYLRQAREFNPSADNNWRLLPVPGVKLRFLSSPKAQVHLARYPQVRFVRENTDGSALYEVAP
ncbi:MAG: bifunctional 2',3'-cyclic-nucleotide 2'-phosphodiesterase/3'-nucleotidase [Aquabacterium sp.]